MRVKYHYLTSKKERVIRFLEENQITYKLTELPESKEVLCTFDLYDDQEVFGMFKIQFPFISLEAIKTIEYSKEDIKNAEWLSVRSKSRQIDWIFSSKAFLQTCPYKKLFIKEPLYKHIEQIGELSIGKVPKWGKRLFFSGPSTADDILFCSELAKSVLENKLDGLLFKKVKNKQDTNYVDDIYQLYFDNTLPIEAIHSGQLVSCNSCGKKIIRIGDISNELEIKREYLSNPYKVYKTGEILTEQKIGHVTFSINLVPKSFYDLCEEKQMNHGMIYEPIKLV